MPDWACEVISTSSGLHDRIRKARLYARAGVAHFWLVDPELQSLEVYRLVGAHYSLVQAFASDEKGRFEPFGQAELSLTPWWGLGE